jgi:alpha/beta superfamily hydrolase
MSIRPAAPLHVKLDGPTGCIEASVEDPGIPTAPYAILCHPHPQFGGTMDNKVVTTVARALQSCGMPTVRFNFRGVGASAGTFDAGRGETADALAVASWGERRWPGRPLLLAGFSFGAYVAMRVAQSRTLCRLITIAPPVGRFDFSSLGAPDCPWLTVQGDADDVVDPQAVLAWVGATSPAARVLMLRGVGHFFHGHLHELRDAVIHEVRSGCI